MHDSSPPPSQTTGTTGAPAQPEATTPPPQPGGPAPEGFTPAHSREEPYSELEQRVVDAVKTVFDPEIPVNVYELGLIYTLSVDAEGAAALTMTLTSPACPVAGSLPGDIENTVRKVEEIQSVKVEVTWDPAWTPEMMTEAARLQLGMF